MSTLSFYTPKELNSIRNQPPPQPSPSEREHNQIRSNPKRKLTLSWGSHPILVKKKRLEQNVQSLFYGTREGLRQKRLSIVFGWRKSNPLGEKPSPNTIKRPPITGSLFYLGPEGLSCSFAFNGNSVFCLQIFNLWQKHFSLSSLALEPKKKAYAFLGFSSHTGQKKRLEQNVQSLFYGTRGIRTHDQGIMSPLRYRCAIVPFINITLFCRVP